MKEPELIIIIIIIVIVIVIVIVMIVVDEEVVLDALVITVQSIGNNKKGRHHRLVFLRLFEMFFIDITFILK